jgi:ketosteroid isomerase-like protein
MTSDDIAQLEERWRVAEVAGDTAALDQLTAPEFRLVGPLGFVLTKPQWLQRYDGGGLVTTALEWRDVEIQLVGDTAVSVGVHDQRATYQGRPSDGTFRSTHIWQGGENEWRLLSMQLSPIGAFAPPR